MTSLPVNDVPFASPEARPGDDHLIRVAVADGLVLVAWSLLGQALLGALVFSVMAVAGVDLEALAGPSLGATLVVIVSGTLAGALAWLVGRGRLSWRLLGSVRPSLWHVVVGVLWGLLALIVSVVIVWVGSLPFGELEESGQSLLDAEMLVGMALALNLVIAGLLSPLLEELTFRAVLFQSIGRRVGWRRGAVISSVVFALVHVEVIAPFRLDGLVFLVALFAVGLVFAVSFHRSRSLVVAIVAHATFNIAQLLFAASAVS